MELQTLANVGEFLGGLAVIVSLIYLAVQIRSNTSSQQSETYARSLERMASMQAFMAKDHAFTKMFNEGLIDPSQLTVTQKIQFSWVLTEMFGNFEFMFFQCEQRNLPVVLWDRWEETMKWWLTFPGVVAWWKGKPTPFTPAFMSCVEECIAQGYQPESPGAWESFIGANQPD
jgi:hypothetical protein